MPNRSGGAMPSQRQLRVGELVRHALAEVLARGHVQDTVIESHVITVPEVRMTPDLKLATCYVMPLGGRDEAAVVEALNRNARFLRGELARRRLGLKFMPELRFRVDGSFDEGSRIDALLRQPEVRRDLDAPDGPGGEETDR